MHDGGSRETGAEERPSALVLEGLSELLGDTRFEANDKRRALLRFLVLESLAGRGKLLKGSYVARHVFGRGEDFDPSEDAIVRVEARRLRANLDSYYLGPGRDAPIRFSIPEGGYRPKIEVVEPEVVPDAPATVEPGGRARPSRAMLARLALACAVVMALLYGVRSGPGEPAATVQVARSIEAPRVMIRPFVSLAPAGSSGAYATGMTYQLAHDLQQFSEFRVHLQDHAADGLPASDIADGLIPTFFAEGSLDVVDDRLLAQAQLFDAEEQLIWSGSYERDVSPESMLSVQKEIAGQIAEHLGQPYGAVRRALTQDLRNVSGVALPSYGCVLRGYEYRRTLKPELYRDVRACLERAVVEDPGYAEAWGLLAMLRQDGALYGYEPDVAPAEAKRLVRAAGETAVALDPSNVPGLKALSTHAHYEGRFGEAQDLARRLLSVRPHDPDALIQVGWLLALRGNFEEGMPHVHEAVRRSVDVPPRYFHVIAIDHLVRGEYREMLIAAQRDADDDSSVSHSLVAIAQGGLGLEDAARASLERMAERWSLMATDPATAYGIHQVHPEIVERIVDGLVQAGWGAT
jgi:TolB-like protein